MFSLVTGITGLGPCLHRPSFFLEVRLDDPKIFERPVLFGIDRIRTSVLPTLLRLVAHQPLPEDCKSAIQNLGGVMSFRTITNFVLTRGDGPKAAPTARPLRLIFEYFEGGGFEGGKFDTQDGWGKIRCGWRGQRGFRQSVADIPIV